MSEQTLTQEEQAQVEQAVDESLNATDGEVTQAEAQEIAQHPDVQRLVAEGNIVEMAKMVDQLMHQKQKANGEARNYRLEKEQAEQQLQELVSKIEEEQKQAERAKMEEVERLNAEKQDLFEKISQLENKVVSYAKEKFETHAKYEFAKNGAKDTEYMKYLYEKQNGGLTPETANPETLSDFIFKMKSDRPDLFSQPEAPKPVEKPLANTGLPPKAQPAAPTAPQKVATMSKSKSDRDNFLREWEQVANQLG